MEITIKRHTTGEYGTFGVMLNGDRPLCDTLELPWLDNKPQVSCIPEGKYQVEPYLSPSKGKVWLLKDVPNRSMIEIHVGNWTSDIKGCIAPGSGYIETIPGVARSREAFNFLRSVLPSTFTLVIIDLFDKEKS